jgi:hypothetical protein
MVKVLVYLESIGPADGMDFRREIKVSEADCKEGKNERNVLSLRVFPVKKGGTSAGFRGKGCGTVLRL